MAWISGWLDWTLAWSAPQRHRAEESHRGARVSPILTFRLAIQARIVDIGNALSFHTCPWWLGYLLVTPLRRLLENPGKILAPHVRPGMIAREPGPAMGSFTLELARLVGPGGRVVAVDLEEKMLAALLRRAQQAGLAERIETRRCRQDDLGIGDLAGQVDFVLLFHMLHEVSDQDRFLRAVRAALKPGGAVLFAEPPGHVSIAAIQASVKRLTDLGFQVTDSAAGRKLRVLLRRPLAFS